MPKRSGMRGGGDEGEGLIFMMCARGSALADDDVLQFRARRRVFRVNIANEEETWRSRRLVRMARL